MYTYIISKKYLLVIFEQMKIEWYLQRYSGLILQLPLGRIIDLFLLTPRHDNLNDLQKLEMTMKPNLYFVLQPGLLWKIAFGERRGHMTKYKVYGWVPDFSSCCFMSLFFQVSQYNLNLSVSTNTFPRLLSRDIISQTIRSKLCVQQKGDSCELWDMSYT